MGDASNVCMMERLWEFANRNLGQGLGLKIRRSRKLPGGESGRFPVQTGARGERGD